VRKSCWCAAGFLFFQEEFLCISTGRYRGGVFSVTGSAGMLLACLLAVSSSAVFVFFPSCFRFGVTYPDVAGLLHVCIFWPHYYLGGPV
jgi:hypothetical protein